MPAAVYLGDGEMAVRELDVPALGAARGARRGVALRHLRHRPASRARAVRPPRQRPRPRVGRARSPRSAPTCSGWEVGARVVQNPTPGCGECRACRRGRPSVCLRREPPDLLAFTRGAFCRYKVVPESRLLRVPDALSTRAAALTEPTAIAIHTVNLSGATPDDRVLVTGGGPVGLLTTAVLRARGIDDITVSEPAPLRRERALAVGAARVIEPDELRAAADGPARSPSRTRSRSSARATRPPRSRRSTSSTTRARSCSSGPATTCRGSTTTARSCSSSRSSPPTTTTSRASRPRSTCSRRAGSRSTRSSRPTTCCSTTCSARCTASRRASCPAR